MRDIEGREGGRRREEELGKYIRNWGAKPGEQERGEGEKGKEKKKKIEEKRKISKLRNKINPTLIMIIIINY